MNLFIYQNNDPPIHIIAPSLEEFLKNPNESFPEIASDFTVSLDRIEEYIIEDNIVREKKREDKILLDGKIELLYDGEYIENLIIKTKEKPEGIYKYIWDKNIYEWLEGLTLDETKEVKRLEMKGIRDSKNEEDIAYGNDLFDGDLNSKNKLFQASQIFKETETEVDWITTDNKIAKLKGKDLENIVVLFSTREQDLFTVFADRLTSIESCEDIENVKKIKWEE